jgi:hypothetical protein
MSNINLFSIIKDYNVKIIDIENKQQTAVVRKIILEFN